MADNTEINIEGLAGLDFSAFDDLYARALTPEWQYQHRAMGFISPLADLYESLGFYDNEEES